MKTTPWSKTAAQIYCGGDFSHFATTTEIDRGDLAACGDGLFRFLMTELSAEEDCDSREEAVRRLESARRNLDEVIVAIEASTLSGGHNG